MTERSQRTKALAFLLLALAAGGGAVLAAAGFVLDRQRAIAVAEARLERLQVAARRGGVAAGGTGAGLLLAGDTTGRAAAELQLRVGAAARELGATVRSMQILSPKREGDLTEIVLEVSLQAGTTALRDLTHFLETSSPLLIIDELGVRRSAESAEAAAGSAVQLAVDMKIRGFTGARDTP